MPKQTVRQGGTLRNGQCGERPIEGRVDLMGSGLGSAWSFLALLENLCSDPKAPLLNGCGGNGMQALAEQHDRDDLFFLAPIHRAAIFHRARFDLDIETLAQ